MMKKKSAFVVYDESNERCANKSIVLTQKLPEIFHSCGSLFVAELGIAWKRQMAGMNELRRDSDVDEENDLKAF